MFYLFYYLFFCVFLKLFLYFFVPFFPSSFRTSQLLTNVVQPDKKYCEINPEEFEAKRREMIEISTSVVSDHNLMVVSQIICYIVSSHLNEGKTEELVKDFRTSSTPSPPSEPSLNPTTKLLNKIIKFFSFVRHLVNITTAELAHTLNLICSFIQNESESRSPKKASIINQNTLGTLFLCGMMISLKMNRDHCLKNSYWAKTLNIQLDVLNASEIAFLEKIQFSLFLDESDYCELFDSIVDLRAS